MALGETGLFFLFDSDECNVEGEVEKPVIFSQFVPRNHLERHLGLFKGFLKPPKQNGFLQWRPRGRSQDYSHQNTGLSALFREGPCVQGGRQGVVYLQGGMQGKLKFMFANNIVELFFHLNQFFVPSSGVKKDHGYLPRV